MYGPNQSADVARHALLTFANTHADGGGAVERFADAEHLHAWLGEVGWLGAEPGRNVTTDADAAEARQLRDALVTVLLEHANDPAVTDTDLAQAETLLSRAGQRYPVAADIDRAGARLRPIQDGLPGTLARVLAAAGELALAGDWPRVKACRNQPCHLAFVDRTRNTSAGYCSPQCASQASMRAYRARRRADPSQR